MWGWDEWDGPADEPRQRRFAQDMGLAGVPESRVDPERWQAADARWTGRRICRRGRRAQELCVSVRERHGNTPGVVLSCPLMTYQCVYVHCRRPLFLAFYAWCARRLRPQAPSQSVRNDIVPCPQTWVIPRNLLLYPRINERSEPSTVHRNFGSSPLRSNLADEVRHEWTVNLWVSTDLQTTGSRTHRDV